MIYLSPRRVCVCVSSIERWDEVKLICLTHILCGYEIFMQLCVYWIAVTQPVCSPHERLEHRVTRSVFINICLLLFVCRRVECMYVSIMWVVHSNDIVVFLPLMDQSQTHIHESRHTSTKYICSGKHIYATPSQSIQQFHPSHDSLSQLVHVQTLCRKQGLRTYGAYCHFRLSQFNSNEIISFHLICDKQMTER